MKNFISLLLCSSNTMKAGRTSFKLVNDTGIKFKIWWLTYLINNTFEDFGMGLPLWLMGDLITDAETWYKGAGFYLCIQNLLIVLLS